MPATLSPLDAAFLQVEDDRHPMQLAGVLTFDGPAPTFAEFRDSIAQRLPRLPHFTRRLIRLHSALRRAQWEEAAQFNLDDHLSEVTYDGRATERDVLSLVGELTVAKLDPARPQWRMALVHGLEEDRFGIALTVHHCMVDGLSIMEIFATLFSTSPGGTTELPTAVPPSSSASVKPTGKRMTSHLRTTVAMLGNTNGRRLSRIEPSSERLISVATLPLAEVSAIRKKSGVTINTLMLSAVAGGLKRQYERGSLPEQDVYAFVPVNRRDSGHRGFHGNQIAMTYPRLFVAEPDPRKRLDLITDEVARCATDRQADTTALLVQATGSFPNGMAAVANRLFQYRAGIFDLTITNVPGPPIPVYFLGRKLHRIVGSTPLTRKHPLTVAILSYNGEITVAVTVDPQRLPYGGHLAADIVASFRDLEATFET